MARRMLRAAGLTLPVLCGRRGGRFGFFLRFLGRSTDFELLHSPVEVRFSPSSSGDDLDCASAASLVGVLERGVPQGKELAEFLRVPLERLDQPGEGGVEEVVVGPGSEVDPSAEEVASGSLPVVGVAEPGDEALSPSKGAPSSPGLSPSSPWL